MFEQLEDSMSWPLLTVLVVCISVLFLGLGWLARFRPAQTAALFLGALSVAGAVLLIVSLTHPYTGLIRVSDASVRSLIASLGQ